MVLVNFRILEIIMFNNQVTFYLPWKADIGSGLHISHFGPITINPKTKMGENRNISQGKYYRNNERG